MKDALKWIPFAGQVCYVLDYPLIKRYSTSEIRKNKQLIAKNKENVRTACWQLKKHPATVVNFLEGTRNKGTKQEASPYTHLLPPQAGGTAEVLQILDPEIQTLLDVTLCYKKGTTLVDFALGKVPKITVHYKKVPLDTSWRGDFYTDRMFRADIAKKLNALWQEKDGILSTWHKADQRTKMLIVKLTSFGDCIHTLPAISDLRKHFPDAHIAWAIDPLYTEIADWHPAVDEIIPIPLKQIKRAPRNKKTWIDIYHAIQQLQNTQYDYILDVYGLWKSAIICHLAHGKSCCFDKHSIRDKTCTIVYDRLFNIPKTMHAVTRSQYLFAQACGYSVDNLALDYHIENNNIPRKNYILIFHGTTWDNKHYPEAHWQTVISLACQQGYAVYMMWGNAEEKARAERLATIPGAKVLPKCTITDAKKWISEAKGAIGVDTGFSHLAAATSTPCVGIYGPTNPELAKNYGVNQVFVASTMPCAPCHKRTCRLAGSDYMRCMQIIEPETLWNTFYALLNKTIS